MSVIDILHTDRKYNIIYADPPWQYNDKGCNGNAEKHYSTMKLADICELPVKDLAAEDCVLFLWATYPMLENALKVIKSWGFRYKTLGFQWVKTNKRSGGTSSVQDNGREETPRLVYWLSKESRINSSRITVFHRLLKPPSVDIRVNRLSFGKK